jgi:hypothetical protein
MPEKLKLWRGTVSPKSPTACYTLPLIGKGASPTTNYAKLSYRSLMDYYWNKTANGNNNDAPQQVPSLFSMVPSLF